MMDELKPCPFCGNAPNQTPNHTIICNTCHREVLPDVWQTRPIEDALQKRVEELESRLKQALHFEDDTADGYDWQVLESAFKYDDLRASISEAVEEIDNMRDFEPEDQFDTEWFHAVMRVLDILRRHGLVEEK